MRISEMLGLKGRRYVVRDIFVFKQTGVRRGRAVGEFHATGYSPGFLARLRASGIELPAEMFAERVLAPAGEQGAAEAAVVAVPLNGTDLVRPSSEDAHG
jgi:hypothetical protein